MPQTALAVYYNRQGEPIPPEGQVDTKQKEKIKESKKGRVTLYQNEDGFFTDIEGASDNEVLETVFENGKLIKEYSFDEIRERASEIV